MSISTLFLVIACVVSALGTWSRWWPSPAPYYPAFVCLSLFFFEMSFLWPQIGK